MSLRVAFELLREFPRAYTNDTNNTNEKLCPICLVSISFDRVVWTTCRHAFHRACVNEWINMRHSPPTCPTCRRAV